MLFCASQINRKITFILKTGIFHAYFFKQIRIHITIYCPRNVAYTVILQKVLHTLHVNISTCVPKYSLKFFSCFPEESL